jgi:RHS repeat-associated protein
MGVNSNNKATRQTGATTKGNNQPTTEAPGALVKGAGAGASSAKGGKKKAKKKKKGDPVSVATGAVVDSHADLLLAGAFPFLFTRTYSSLDAGTPTPLGRSGWTHSYHQWIEVDSGDWLHVGPDLAETRYARVLPGQSAFDRGTRTILTHKMDGIFELRSLENRLVRDFAPISPGGRSVLRGIRDAWGNRVELRYAQGQLVTFVDTAGREVRVAHDARGQLTALEVYAQGRVHKTLRYQYTEEGDLGAFVDEIGRATRYAYDGMHRLVRKTLPNDLNFYYQYDPDSGRCVISRGDADLHKVEFTYDDAAKTTTTHGEPEPRVFHWDDKGQILKEETFDKSYVETYEYDDDGFLTGLEDAEGKRVEFEYDARGAVVKRVDAAGNETLFEYAQDRCVKRVRPGGLEETYTYDGNAALVGVRYADGQTVEIVYDGAGHVTALYGGPPRRVALQWRKEYDGQHRVVRWVDARGAEWRFVYDALGRPVERWDPLGRVKRLRFDLANRIVSVEHPDGTADVITRDARDNPIRVEQCDGKIIEARYSARLLVEQRYEDGSAWKFEYDRLERLIAVLNPKAERYEFRYDRAGHIVEETTFDGRVQRYTYSRGNRLSRIEYADGTWRQYAYGPLGHVVQEETPDGPATFVRDNVGRLLQATLEDGPLSTTIRFERDKFGRVISETQSEQTIRYGYDDQGRLATQTMPNGQRTEYAYDVLSTLTDVVHEGQRLHIDRDIVGHDVHRTLFDGAAEMHSLWDEEKLVGRAVRAPQPGGALPRLLSRREWQYTATGALVEERDAFAGTTTYAHSPLRDLVGASSGAVSEQFRYDAAGSITEALTTLGRGGAWDVAQGNVLLRTPTDEYDNDDNHRRTRKVDRATGEVTTYEWDCRQRLRRVRLPDGSVATYFYDALGRRLRKEIASPDPEAAPRVIRFMWSARRLVAEQDSARAERVFVYEPGSYQLLLQSESARVYAYVLDPAGKPRELVDHEGRVAWRPTYSAWGKVIDVQRDPGCRGPEVSSPFRLLGHYWDEESGLGAALFRYFDPDTARWLSPDPWGITGGVNLFGFDGSPATDADPLGLEYTGEQYDDDGNITPGYYAYLRRQTPTDDLRKQVNDEAEQGPNKKPVCPLTQEEEDSLEADHIVPMKSIVGMDGFSDLDEEDQLAVLNLKDNFWGISKTMNCSKGGKSIDNEEEPEKSWTKYKGEDLHDDQLALLQEKDAAAKAAIKMKIKALLAKAKKC